MVEVEEVDVDGVDNGDDCCEGKLGSKIDEDVPSITLVFATKCCDISKTA